MEPRIRKQSISEELFWQLEPGDEIVYLLTPEMLPTNPLREWHGRVERVMHAYQAVEVELLDEGYEENREWVRRSEIISVTKRK